MEILYETGIKQYCKRKYMFAMFKCECGKELEMAKLRGISTKNCWECFRKIHKEKVTKHGDRYTRLYRTWINMNKRCRDASYKTYHGKNITVCGEWKEYENFKIWAYNNGYTDKLTIDRIDVNSNYEPNNCQWLNNKINAGKDKCHISKENVIKIRSLYKTNTYSQKQLAIEFNTDIRIIHRIVKNKSYIGEYYE